MTPRFQALFAALLFASGSSSGCLVTNPDWDPPATADGETGLDETDLDETDPDEMDPDETGVDTSDELVCGEGLAAEGPCPAGCDLCEGGVCVQLCVDKDCRNDTVVCPANWPCRIECYGHDACKDATLVCAGEGDCEVECVGDTACEKATVRCARGPCRVSCAADYDQPCKQTDVLCGENTTSLECGDQHHGDPTLIGEGDGPCACERHCEADSGGDDGDEEDDD